MARFHPYPATEFTGEKDQPPDVFNSESGDLQFPGTGLRKNLQESKGQHVQTQVTEGYADKNQAQRLPSHAAQLHPPTPSSAPSDTHPRPPQTSPKQAATLHSPGPTSRDLGIPRRGGPAGNAGRCHRSRSLFLRAQPRI